MIKRKFLAALVIGVLCIAFVPGCEDDPPQSIYNESYVNTAGVPGVSTVVPEGSPYILGGVTTIVVNGSGFVTDTSKLNVYFNSTRVNVSSVTATQIKILAPNMIQDSIKVRVFITGSDKFSDLKYINIRSAMIYIKEVDSSKVAPAAITTNKQGDLFVSVISKAGVSDGIYKLTTAGVYSQYASRAIAPPLATEPLFSGMKVKGDSLYAARRTRLIISRNSGSGMMNIFSASYPASQLPIIVDDFDYDNNKLLWAGGSTANGGLISIDATKKVVTYPLAGLLTGVIRSVRFYNGALYVSNESSDSINAVYKIPVNADSTLGTPTKYFDLNAAVGSNFKKVYGITFDNSGNLYVGTDAAAGIYVVAPDKSFSALYNGVIGPSCRYLAWGNDSYMYVVREKTSDGQIPTGLFKVDMLGKVSAPYHGQ
ncbi:MAG: IPT/TIG domain-containing protein [Bacteroidota bacterium]